MEEEMRSKYVTPNWIVTKLKDAIIKLLVTLLSIGPIPNHIAFIMDGNRRYAKKHKMKEIGMGHRLGIVALNSALEFCYKLGVKHVTIYAFSIDNFKRRPEEVKSLMELLTELMESYLKKSSVVNQNGVRVHVAGDLTLLDESVMSAAKRVMVETSGNYKAGLSACIAYTSTDEIRRAVQKACDEKEECVSLEDVERCLDLSVASDPDIVIRTSGETRLSNFMTWQSVGSLLCSLSAEWPEIGVWHLFWTILKFQRMKTYFVKKKMT